MKRRIISYSDPPFQLKITPSPLFLPFLLNFLLPSYCYIFAYFYPAGVIVVVVVVVVTF